MLIHATAQQPFDAQGDDANSSDPNVRRISHGLTENDNEDEDGWGIVDSAAVTSNAGELENTGILILPGDDEASASVEEPAPTKVSKTSAVANLLEDPAGLGPSIIPSDIPSDLESLPDPDVSIPVTDTTAKDCSTPTSVDNKPIDHVAIPPVKVDETPAQDFAFDDKESQAPSEGLGALKEELAMVEAFFAGLKEKKTVLFPLPRTIVLAAVGVAALLSIGSAILYERRAWQASNTRLEERIELLQLELLAKIEDEKKQDIQRQVEIANLKQEFKQALHERETKRVPQADRRQHHRKPPPPTATMSPELSGLFESAFASDNNSNYQFENCWIHAEAKLGDCAQKAKKAKNAFRSKLQTIGRSLWNAQEHLVYKVNDFGKKVQTAAKEAAERVVLEAEQWSTSKNYSHQRSNKQDHNMTAAAAASSASNTHANFKSMATTLVSSVAFASLATVVADKATSYVVGMGEEQED